MIHANLFTIESVHGFKETFVVSPDGTITASPGSNSSSPPLITTANPSQETTDHQVNQPGDLAPENRPKSS